MEIEKSYKPVIEVIGEKYEIPQLGRTRRIAALLPHDYHETDTRYPVLFLHDGQNLYSKEAPFGNWGAVETLAQLAEKGNPDIILIAIDHGDEDRVTEYSPYYNERFGEGNGDLYLQFLIQTLKPYVDQHFRTLPGREHTGVGGSSMGGLISLAAGIRHPETFGKMMVFSPSLWINPKVFKEAENFSTRQPIDLYLYAGAKESMDHLRNIRRLKAAFLRNEATTPFLKYKLSVNPEGKHSEYFWGEELPKALEWLFGEKTK